MEGNDYMYNANREDRTGGVSAGRTLTTMAPKLNDVPPDPIVKASFRELFRSHWHSTITYCSVFWSFGMSVAFLGPTLLDLGCLTATDMKTISWIFFAQLLCSLIGSVSAGVLVAKRLDPDVVLLVATASLPVAMFIVPFCRVLAALAVVLGFMGLNMGCLDCLTNLQMIHIYGEAVAPFLQAMHFCYGLGAFVSPMIVEPFLLNEDCSPFIHHTASPRLNVWGNTTVPAETLEEAQSMTQVRYAFWIMAALQVPIPGLMAILLMKNRWRGRTSNHQRLVNSTSDQNLNGKPIGKKEYENIDKPKATTIDPWQGTPPFGPQDSLIPASGFFASRTSQVVGITAVAATMVFLYDGLQSAYGGYVYSYAVKSIVDLNKTEGAYLNACFWGMFALGRLLSIFLATRLTPAFMLLCNIIGCTLSMVLMLSERHDHIALYFGTCFFGLFLSSVTPTALSLAELYIDMTSAITTFIVVVAALGEMIFPVIIGNLFVSAGPVSFLVCGAVTCGLTIVDFAVFWYIGQHSPKNKACQTGGAFVWCRAVCYLPHRPEPNPEDGLNTTRHVRYYSQMSESSSNIELVPQDDLPAKAE